MAKAEYLKLYVGKNGATVRTPGSDGIFDQSADRGKLPHARDEERRCIFEFEITEVSKETVTDLNITLGYALDNGGASDTAQAKINLELYDASLTSLTNLKQTTPSTTGLIGQTSSNKVTINASGPPSKDDTKFNINNLNITEPGLYYLYCYATETSGSGADDISIWPGPPASISNAIIDPSTIICISNKDSSSAGGGTITEKITLKYRLDSNTNAVQENPVSDNYFLPYIQYIENSTAGFNYGEKFGTHVGLLDPQSTFDARLPNYYLNSLYAWVDKTSKVVYSEYGPNANKGEPYNSLHTHQDMANYLKGDRDYPTWGDTINLYPNFICDISYQTNGGNPKPPKTTKTNFYEGVQLSNIVPKKDSTNAPNLTITFDANGGTTTITSKIVTGITHYSFSHWTTPSGGEYAPGDIYTDPNRKGSIALEAVYDYSTEREITTLPTAQECTRSGYTLLGWAYSPTTSVIAYKPGATAALNHDTTLYAVWQGNEITYNIEYRSSYSNKLLKTETKTARVGTSVTIMPTHTDYYIAPSYQTVVWQSTAQTITFICEPHKLKITYKKDINPNSTTAYSECTKKDYQDMVTSGIYIDTRGHYEWYNNENGLLDATAETFKLLKPGYKLDPNKAWKTTTGTELSEVTNYTPLQLAEAGGQGNNFKIKDVEIEVYANWIPNTCTVYFDPNGGLSDTMITQQKTINSPYGTLPVPTREGYVFTGWYTSANGGTKITSSTIVTNTSDHTLYAHWSPNHISISSKYSGQTSFQNNPHDIYIYNSTEKKYEQYIAFVFSNGKWVACLDK